MSESQSIFCYPLSKTIGMAVDGLDLNRAIEPDIQAYIYDLWLKRGLLRFRGGSEVSPEQHIRLSRCFGELELHPLKELRLPNNPELILLPPRGKRAPPINYYDGEARVGRIHWHSDMIYTTRPTRGSLLHVVEVPEEGGQTAWIDTALAYDYLPADLKSDIQHLEARFGFNVEGDTIRFGRNWETFRTEGERSINYSTFPDVAHPLVTEHPITKRKALTISPLHIQGIIGMNSQRSDALINTLVNHCLQDRFRYIHQWKRGDIVLWDNLRTLHCAYGTPPGLKRRAHRTTLRNDYTQGRTLSNEGEHDLNELRQ